MGNHLVPLPKAAPHHSSLSKHIPDVFRVGYMNNGSPFNMVSRDFHVEICVKKFMKKDVKSVYGFQRPNTNPRQLLMQENLNVHSAPTQKINSHHKMELTLDV